MTFWQNINNKMFRSGSKLYLLIGVNVIVFLAISAFSIFEKLVFRTDVVDTLTQEYLALPAYLPKLAVRFWTPLTYMFIHANFFHVLFNMLLLYWMGQIFEEFLGEKRTLGLYLLGGLSGAILFVLCYNIFPAFTQTGLLGDSTAVGASAAIMAIIVGAATIVPNYTIMLFGVFSVKIKWIAIFYIVVDFLGVVGPNAGGELAHLGGALFGFIYVKQVQNGRDMIAAIAGIFKKRSKLKVASTNREKNTVDTPRQEEIDRILDKISTIGYENLSNQEKETLFRASKNEVKK